MLLPTNTASAPDPTHNFATRGNTLLHISILNHHQEAARRLIDGGADWKVSNTMIDIVYTHA